MKASVLAVYLLDKVGQIKGKKAFQKLVYLAMVEGVPLNYSYSMYIYGPYSESVANEFEHIYKEDIIDLPYDGSYIYQKGTMADQVLEDGITEIECYTEELDRLLNRFGNMSPRELEIYCTAHFIWENQLIFKGPTDRISVIEEIKKAKYPKFNITEIERAYDTLVTWGLIKVS